MRQDQGQPTIQIQEPPLKHIRKKRSCLLRSCVTGGGCLGLVIALIIIGLRFSANLTTKELKAVPENFPPSIPLYNTEYIESITLVPASAKQRTLEVAAFVPKVILSPLIFALNPEATTLKDIHRAGERIVRRAITIDDLLRLFKAPITVEKDTVVIIWTKLGAEPAFIEGYYSGAFENARYKKTAVTTANVNQRALKFVNDAEGVTAFLFIEDADKNKGTDYVSLTVDY